MEPDKPEVIGKVVGDKVVSVDSSKARSDAKILKQAGEILEDKNRLDAVRMVQPDINIVSSGKGPAFRGSKPLDIGEIMDNEDNIHNVFRNVTKHREKKE